MKFKGVSIVSCGCLNDRRGARHDAEFENADYDAQDRPVNRTGNKNLVSPDDLFRR
jgi:hypothetical protein